MNDKSRVARSPVQLEVCVDSVAAAVAAAAGGADRVELCSGLAVGGLTPSDGLVRLVRRRVELPVHVLLRPRDGDFCYDDEELATLRADLERLTQLGVDGVVLGVLEPRGTVDREATARLIAAARPLSITFHRAMDVTRDPHEALEALLGLGVDRVLTSGQEATALAGAAVIAALVEQAGDRLAVMAGAGVNATTAAELVQQTGVSEVHASCRHAWSSPMTWRNPRCHMGTPDGPDEYQRTGTEVARVQALRAALQTVSR
jgi:copper homeostasis protein